MSEENKLPVVALGQPATVEALREQAKIIQEAISEVMKENEHFGVIPGTKKPTLLKSGAEKLCVLFRLSPQYTVQKTLLENGHREYEVTCVLTHITTQCVMGEGLGSCSTLESKYRWRKSYNEEVVGNVSRDYWNIPKEQANDRHNQLVKEFGPGKYKIKKTGGNWNVLKIEGDGERVENPDIADVYNTVLKIAKKRSHVDAVLTVTAASDFFTQDLEDLRGSSYDKSTGEVEDTEVESWNVAMDQLEKTGKEVYKGEWHTKKSELVYALTSKSKTINATDDPLDLDLKHIQALNALILRNRHKALNNSKNEPTPDPEPVKEREGVNHEEDSKNNVSTNQPVQYQQQEELVLDGNGVNMANWENEQDDDLPF